MVFVEATNGFNHGKFLVGRFTREQWDEPAMFNDPAIVRSLLSACGWSREVAFVMDLATGEGALFPMSGLARADLNKRRVRVCVLFEPFLEWLYAHRARRPDAWFDELPRAVALPDSPSAFYGYRRPGLPDPEPESIEQP